MLQGKKEKKKTNQPTALIWTYQNNIEYYSDQLELVKVCIWLVSISVFVVDPNMYLYSSHEQMLWMGEKKGHWYFLIKTDIMWV